MPATAWQHDLTLVTRFTKDFIGLDVRQINPWDDQGA
jgi:predicted nucleic acid-binding protein